MIKNFSKSEFFACSSIVVLVANECITKVVYIGKNVFIGANTGNNNAAWDNVFIGNYSGDANTSGTRNVFIGKYSGSTNTQSSYNVAIGFFFIIICHFLLQII